MKCEICLEQDAKYKCPTCGIRYCSLKCYKDPQKHNHTNTNGSMDSDGKNVEPRKFEGDDSTTQTTSVTKDGDSELRTPKLNEIYHKSPELQHLLKYNTVKFHLDKVYKILTSSVTGGGQDNINMSSDMQRQLAIDYLNTLRYGGVHYNEAIEEFCQLFLQILEEH
ncbi:similar to Saccharomyces cerevisiae YJR055W HIT1 Protein of unknown function, required for growth at high temperature [Maudiozyma saulgeensis]|uniref:HIT-type domain-containing protein n=1 Tax=Maudiozyma saulgeensis TaxID=1789683 RepID=A0A1X7R0Z5_9SACH|nr:similar to Saccharomyces cerevisiae YJR055W HIT1 Protein of unknown function, required for growth at high temperature [Kazachstania saulgeensis]